MASILTLLSEQEGDIQRHDQPVGRNRIGGGVNPR